MAVHWLSSISKHLSSRSIWTSRSLTGYSKEASTHTVEYQVENEHKQFLRTSAGPWPWSVLVSSIFPLHLQLLQANEGWRQKSARRPGPEVTKAPVFNVFYWKGKKNIPGVIFALWCLQPQQLSYGPQPPDTAFFLPLPEAASPWLTLMLFLR